MTLTDGDLAKIRSAIAERDRSTKRLDRQVLQAREKGATWTEIGYALGITAQGAQKRYGTGSERSEAHKEHADARAIRRRAKKARDATRRTSVDPWPDGTVQETIDAKRSGEHEEP